jgi:hypothetical protein
MKESSRAHSVGTRVTAAEYARLETCTRDRQVSISEWSRWSREALLAAANRGRCFGGEQAILAEVIALRTIIANVIYAFTNEGKITVSTCGPSSSALTAPN